MNSKRLLICVAIVVSSLLACQSPADKTDNEPGPLRQQAIAELKKNLRTQPKLVKVHAAEFILWLGIDEDNEVHTLFIQEDKRFGTESPYRVPLWRVLAQTETDSIKKKEWINKIVNAWADSMATDRAHAAESLSKLKVSLAQIHPALTAKVVAADPSPLSVYTMWSASNGITNPDSIRANRNVFLRWLSYPNDHIKGIAAYSLRHLGQLTPGEWRQLAEISLVPLSKPEFQVYLLSSAYVNTPADSLSTGLFQQVRNSLLEIKYSLRRDDRMEMAAAFAVKGSSEEIPVLDSLLNNKYPAINDADTALANADIRSVAAHAILRIEDRKKK